MSLWADRVLPGLVEKACRSTTILAERRRWIPRAHGEVLELGVGSGLNLAFYDAARVARVTGIDPAGALLARARPRAEAAPVPVALVAAPAEALPFADRAFDSAVITYSLCSVDEPARALAEVRRVLRPGGELILVEHGLAPPARPRHDRDPARRRLRRRRADLGLHRGRALALVHDPGRGAAGVTATRGVPGAGGAGGAGRASAPHLRYARASARPCRLAG